MTFKEYICSIASSHKPVENGAFIETPKDDFIADASNDSRLPDITDWDHLEGYLICRRACQGALEAARIVWEDYEVYRCS